MLQKVIKKWVELVLFGLVILMLGYAWAVHFWYGAILQRPDEPLYHAVFWSILYPISIFLLASFFGERLGFKRVAVHTGLFLTFLLSGWVLCIGLWNWFWPFFEPHQNAFWTFLSFILVILICISILAELRERIRKT